MSGAAWAGDPQIAAAANSVEAFARTYLIPSFTRRKIPVRIWSALPSSKHGAFRLFRLLRSLCVKAAAQKVMPGNGFESGCNCRRFPLRVANHDGQKVRKFGGSLG